MRKLAVFVEGTTELLFMTLLVEAIAGANNVLINQVRIRGGAKAPRSMTQIQAVKPNTGQQYYVLLVDCGGDELVKSRIMEEHEGLTNQSYVEIIGMRDVRPTFSHADIPKLEAGLQKYIKGKWIPVHFILHVLEIEAWFLAEFNHLAVIDPSLTPAAIHAALAFNPELDDMTLRLTPTADLENCYSLAGKTYQKPANQTVKALNTDYMYFDLAPKIPHLQKLVGRIDTFLS